MIFTCDGCGTIFEKRKRDGNRVKRHFCTYDCYRKFSKNNIKSSLELICLNCHKLFSVTTSEANRGRSFCTRSCGAKYNNGTAIKRKRTKKCRKCDELILSTHTYCARHKEIPIEELKSKESVTHRAYKILGRKCQECGWEKVNPYSGLIPVEVHHKDGDTANNNLSNLIVLCPSCHSLTKNYMFHGRTHK